MNEELQIKLQAFLDGELSEAEAREIGSLIARDADAAALHKELKQTRAALAGFEKRIIVPETREFYWSKIEREISHEQPEAEARTLHHPMFSFWRRALAMGGGLAALVIALLVATMFSHRAAPDMDVALADGDAFTYRNYESGATLVWLSYPAENGLAENQPTVILQ